MRVKTLPSGEERGVFALLQKELSGWDLPTLTLLDD
jgi:hypothetical protein